MSGSREGEGRVGYGGRRRSLFSFSTVELAKAVASRMTSKSSPLYAFSFCSSFLRL